MRVEEELKTYLQVLWRYKWMIIACAVIASTVAFGISTQLTPLYSAAATVRVASAPGGTADYIYVSTLARLSNTYVEIATSEVSLDEVTKRLNLQERPDVEVEIVSETELIRIIATHADPVIARDIANTLAGLMIEQSLQLYGGNAPTSREILEVQLQQAKKDMDSAVAEYERALRANQPSNDLKGESTPVPNPDLETLSHILYVRQQIYADLLQRYENARTSEQLYANAITIIEPATAPERPSTPNLPVNSALGLLAGLASGVILAFLFEGMDGTVRGIEDVQALTSLPILCSVPEIHGVKHGYDVFAPAFHQLCARLLLTGSHPESSALLITSPEPGTGKSTVSANLAMALAAGGSRVVLLDMDFHRPRLHSILDLPNEIGLSDHICGGFSLDAVMQNTPFPNLRVITAGSSLGNTSEWLMPVKIGAIINELRRDGSYVLIDAPAFLSVADPTMIASKVDSVIVVVARRRTERSYLQLMLQQLTELDAKISGVVVNRMPNTNLYRYYVDRRQPKGLSRWKKFIHRRTAVVHGGSSLSHKE